MPLPLTHPAVIKETLKGISFCILIFLIVAEFPLLGIFALLFLPLPVLFYRLKVGRNCGLAIVAVSFLILLIMTRGMAFDILYFGSLLMTGLFLGECLEQHLDIQKTIGYTTALVVGSAFAAFFIYTLTQGVTMGNVLTDYLSAYFEMTIDVYSQMGIEQDQIQQFNSAFMAVFPGMFLISYITTIWLNILIIRTLLKKRGVELKSIEHLVHYRAPELMVWAVIGLGASLMVPLPALKIIGVNGLMVLMLIYFFQGIAVVSFYFQKRKTPTAFKVFCYSLILLQIYVLILVIGLGFFDNWINFRKINTAS